MIVKPPNLSYLHAQFKKAWQILLNNKFHCWFFLALTTLTDLFYYSCAKVIILKSFHQFRYIRWKKYTAVAIAQWLNLKIKGVHKVEKILKGSLDSIPSPSPSMKIQIMGGKVRWALSTNFLFSKSFHPAMFHLFTSSKLSRQ